MRVSRRSFLSGVGAGTAAFLGGSFERQAFGQGAVPKRLLVLYMPNCSIRANWVPKGGRVVGVSGDATQFTLGTANATLEPVRVRSVPATCRSCRPSIKCLPTNRLC